MKVPSKKAKKRRKKQAVRMGVKVERPGKEPSRWP